MSNHNLTSSTFDTMSRREDHIRRNKRPTTIKTINIGIRQGYKIRIFQM